MGRLLGFGSLRFGDYCVSSAHDFRGSVIRVVPCAQNSGKPCPLDGYARISQGFIMLGGQILNTKTRDVPQNMCTKRIPTFLPEHFFCRMKSMSTMCMGLTLVSPQHWSFDGVLMIFRFWNSPKTVPSPGLFWEPLFEGH